MGDWHMCEGTIDMEAYIGNLGLYRDIYCHQDDAAIKIKICSYLLTLTLTLPPVKK